MKYRTLCCEAVPYPDSLEKRKSGMFGRCTNCRQFDLLYELEDDLSPTEEAQERADKLGDYLRDRER